MSPRMLGTSDGMLSRSRGIGRRWPGRGLGIGTGRSAATAARDRRRQGSTSPARNAGERTYRWLMGTTAPHVASIARSPEELDTPAENVCVTSRVLAAGYYGSGNTADEAILAAILQDLRALRPELEFT